MSLIRMFNSKENFWKLLTFTERQLYHNAIDFAKEAFRMYENEDGLRAMKPEHLVALKKIKKDLISLNNG